LRRRYLQIRVHDREEDLHEEIDCIDDDTEQVQPCFAYESVKVSRGDRPVIVEVWMEAVYAGRSFDRRRVDEVGELMACLVGGDDEVVVFRVWGRVWIARIRRIDPRL
jgi:hypothetical protein